MKIKKEFIIVISVITLLAAALLILKFTSDDNKIKSNDESQNEIVQKTVDLNEQILNVQNPDMYFCVTNELENYSVVNELGMWYSPENPNVLLDQNLINVIINKACTLNAISVEKNAEDILKYGLDNPASVFEFKDVDGMSYKINLGIKTPTNSGYYISLNDERNVYILSNEDFSTLFGGINSLRNKKIIDVKAEDIYAVTIANEENVISIKPKTEGNINTHSSSVWEMVTPYRKDVNQYIFEENVIKAMDFTVTDFVDDNPSDYSIYGLDDPKYTITFETSTNEYTVFLGDDKDAEHIYMQISGLSNVYTINKEQVKYIDYTPVYLLDSLVFSRIISYVNTIEFSAGDNHVLSTDGTYFYIDGKEVDEEMYRTAYRSMIASTISGEVEDSLGNELCRYTFYYNTGTPSETVVFYEYGELYAAVEINGITEFYVKRSYVEDIINNINNLSE